MESTQDSLTSPQSMIEHHGKPSAAAAVVDNEDSFSSMPSKNGEVSSKRDHGVPVVDLTALAELSEEERLKIAGKIAWACETWGFFQVINHGIDPGLLHRVQEVSLGFHKLPEEEKLKCQTPTQHGGYYTRKIGGTVLHNAPDYLINFWSPPSLVAKFPDCPYPRSPRDYRSTMAEYSKEVTVLARKLLSMMSEMLGLRPEALNEGLAGETGETRQGFRANYYRPYREDKTGVGLSPHADPGGLTILLQGDVVGLQVEYEDEWVTVEPIPDALVVNVGDQVEILSNGRYKSSLHRGVIHPTEERLSVAGFYAPVPESVIGPLAELHPLLYSSQLFHEYFAVFLRTGYTGRNHVLSRRLDS